MIRCRRLKRKRTAKRHAWLRLLADGHSGTSGNVVGSQCAQLGLTEWSAVEDRHVLTRLGQHTLWNWNGGGVYIIRLVPAGWQP